MVVNKFEELVIWQRSRELIKRVYQLLQDNHDYGFRDQIQRAAISIMNNVAEGFERNRTTKYNALFINYLSIVVGSCCEVKSMLYAAEDLAYLRAEDCLSLRDQCTDIEIKIYALIAALRENKEKRG